MVKRSEIDAMNEVVLDRIETLKTQLIHDVDAEAIPDRFWHELPRVLMASDFVYFQLLNRGECQYLRDLITGGLWTPYSVGDHKQRLTITKDLEHLDEQALMDQLRVYRNAVMVNVIWREVHQLGRLEESTLNLSELAEQALALSIDYSVHQLSAKFGRPVCVSGAPQEISVIGLGKLGAYELNLSSDIDIMFVYAQSGTTEGGDRQIDHQRYYTLLGQRIIHLIGQSTKKGFVFRVDVRLRPHGKSGPLAITHKNALAYYQSHGREWERYAMIKARCVAGDLGQGQRFLEQLQPFVYRKYLDYTALESLREMKALIRRAVQKQEGSGNDIKLGAGGIREIEFIVQSIQLTRGGKETALQSQQLLYIFDVISEKGYLDPAMVERLVSAYRFLRLLEHRLQGFADQQTHKLPEDPVVCWRLAQSLGFRDWDLLIEQLNEHRVNVKTAFNDLVAEDPRSASSFDERCLTLWQAVLPVEVLAKLFKIDQTEAEALSREMVNFKQQRNIREMLPISRKRLDQLMPLLLKKVTAFEDSEKLLTRVLKIISAILRRSAYISYLNECHGALDKLLTLCHSSVWIAERIANYPFLLDDVLRTEQRDLPPSREALMSLLAEKMASVSDDDLEGQMECLRQFKLTHEVEVAASDVLGVMPTMKVSDYLTELAEVILNTVKTQVWQRFVAKYGLPSNDNPDGASEPKVIIVAYGKLGGEELSYSSDLDLVFLHPSIPDGSTSGPVVIENAFFYTTLAQRIIQMLTIKTLSGPLYEVDLRLRPSGRNGLLVSSLRTYSKYQMEKAWTWEHQSLVRARVVAASDTDMALFAEIRLAALSRTRNPEQLQGDILEMNQKVKKNHRSARLKPDQFDLKFSDGGILDIEFIVQYLCLRWTFQQEKLITYSDNYRIIEALAKYGVLSQSDASILIKSYLHLRNLGHRQTLQNRGLVVERSVTEPYPGMVQRLWADLCEP